MDTSAIKAVAIDARKQLMEGVERRCLQFGIVSGADPTLRAVGGRVLSNDELRQRQELLRLQDGLREGAEDGHAALVERAAYTWFDRLFAIRFMEANDRLPSHVRLFSAQDGSFDPECLREAMDLPIEGLDREEVASLVAQGDDEELFRTILLAQCEELSGCMPSVFEPVGAAMELLLPDHLLARDGVIQSLVEGVPEESWTQGVEIVGWAYQFYVQERKDAYFATGEPAKRDDIAPATQLFTPEWIVRYLVENSLGRLWMSNRPDSSLEERMEYYMPPREGQREEFRHIDSPEDISLIDPACGSGHILVYAFDLLASMYEESGYRLRDIPRLILAKNLTGLEIDPRAASLASFALTMKACELDPRFLTRGGRISPRITCLQPVEISPEDMEELPMTVERERLVNMRDELAHLDEIGSLWNPGADGAEMLSALAGEMETENGLFAQAASTSLRRAEEYARTLSSGYDCVVANPPYMGSGKMNPWLSEWVKGHYPEEKGDLCTCFVRRGVDACAPGGYTSLITASSWMFISSFERMRENIAERAAITSLIQQSTHGFPSVTVPTCMFTLVQTTEDIEGCYIRLEDFDRPRLQQPKALEAIRNPSCGWRYYARLSSFKSIPGMPFAYYIAPELRNAFAVAKPLSEIARPRKGLGTGNKDLFMRGWWEVPWDNLCLNASDRDEARASGARWFPHNKGGSFRRWYGNNDYVVDWAEDGAAIKSYRNGRGQLAARPQNQDCYFKECVTWSKVSTGQLAFRYKPTGTIFNEAGPAIFGDTDLMLRLEAFLNSSVCGKVAEAISPTLDFQVGQVATYPILPEVLTEDTVGTVRELTKDAKDDWDSSEVSWDFLRHPLVRGDRLEDAYAEWSEECRQRHERSKKNEEDLNERFIHIYNMEGEADTDVPHDRVSARLADRQRDVKSLVSFAVGCMFGRYSLDVPGLVLAGQGGGIREYLERVPEPTFMPDEDGILPVTDDEYFEDDIVTLFVGFMSRAYGEGRLEENLRFVADSLGGSGSPRQVLRNYFSNCFYADHCATYNLPGTGKRPIYWMLESGPLGGFRAMLYVHRYTPDLLARVRTDYVHERQERYRSRISELESQKKSASKSDAREIDRELRTTRAQLDETNKFEERLHHLADQMIELDLNDGVKSNYARLQSVLARIR